MTEIYIKEDKLQNNNVVKNQSKIAKFISNSKVKTYLIVRKVINKQTLGKVVKSHYFWVFIFGLVLNAFIFRDVLATYPEIFKGNALVGPEELVPITDFQTQFIDQQLNPFSELTGNYEFRVRYSLLTTWTRFYLALPLLGLVGLNAVSLTIIYAAIYRVLNFFFKAPDKQNDKHKLAAHKTFLITSSLIAALIPYFVLLYAKITHFYTLIFGFSLFALASSILITILLNYHGQTRNQRNRLVLFVILLTVFNPATHYVILTIFIGAILFTFSFFFNIINLIKDRSKWKTELYRSLYLLSAIILSAAFYLAYYFSYVTTFNKFSVSEYVFITNNLIQNASSSFTQITSLQTGSILDFYHYSDYQIDPPVSRLFNLFYSLTIPAIFIFSLFQFKKPKGKTQIAVSALLFIIGIIAIFFAFGFNNQYSAHSLTAQILPYLNDHPNFISNLLIQVISTFFLVLRFPHRFLFIYELVVGFSFGIFIMILLNFFNSKFKFYKTIFRHTILILTGIILLLPFFYGEKVSTTLLSGNYDGFLNSYTIPQDLKDIKNYINKNGGGKLAILPSTEIPGRLTLDGNNSSTKLIDKFFIYYLDYPSEYYGLSGSLSYKNNYFLIYLSAYNHQNWFNFLRNKDIEYILVNKKQIVRNQFNSLNNIEKTFADNANDLVNEGIATKAVSGDNFDLIKINKNYVEEQTKLYLNSDWQKTQDSFTNNDVEYPNNSLYNISKDLCSENKFEVMGELEKTIEDINILCNKNILEYNSKLTPFSNKVQSTNDFISNIFSMITTAQSSKENKYNTLNSINPGTYNSLSPEILFIDKPEDTLTYSFNVKDTSSYNIDARVRSANSKIEFTIYNSSGDIKYQAKQTLQDDANFVNSNGDIVLNNFKYYNLAENINFEKGNYLVKLSKIDDSAIGVDTLTFTTAGQLDSVKNQYTITQTDTDIYQFVKK